MKNILSLIGAIFSVAILLVLLVSKYFDPYEAYNISNRASAYNQYLSIGDLTIGYPDSFVLVIGASELLPNWPEPACDLGFDYCLYSSEKNTGLVASVNSPGGSAIRINKRTNLVQKDSCLSTAPIDYAAKPILFDKEEYASSLWTEPGATKYSGSKLYRIFVNAKCYELELRTVNLADEPKAASSLREVLESVVLTNTKEKVILPY